MSLILSNIGYATASVAMSAAVGSITGGRTVTAFGERESMGTTATGEDIWRGNELSPAPTSHLVIPTPAEAGEQMTVVSESTNDTAAGTGVQTVSIHYLDAAGDEQDEIVTLNGTTPVNTVATDIRFVNDFHAQTVGTGGVAADNIKIYKTGSVGLVYNMIAAGGNKSLVPHRMVPRGKMLVITSWHAGEAQSKRVNVRIRSTDMYDELLPGVFCFKDTTFLNGTTTGNITLNTPIPALSVVKISGWPDAIGAEVGCSWAGVLLTE